MPNMRKRIYVSMYDYHWSLTYENFIALCIAGINGEEYHIEKDFEGRFLNSKPRNKDIYKILDWKKEDYQEALVETKSNLLTRK